MSILSTDTKGDTLHQLPKYTINDNTRLGRMLAAGRLTATLRSKVTGTHMTISFSAKAKIDGKWKTVPFSEATHVFIQQGQGGWGSAKVGTYYPANGKFYTEKGFDTRPWVWTVTHVLAAAHTGILDTEQYDIQEANRCGKCGKELTDPVSIERGIGPTCADEATGSQHYHKGLEREVEVPPVKLYESRLEAAAEMAAEGAVIAAEEALMDKKGRTLPKTFDELAAAVKS